MTLELKTYKNSTELANINGVPIYMNDMVDAALRGKLNTFLQGDTGSGKTQLVRDVMDYFGDKSLFILGRNDMDTRELFKRINLGKLYEKPSYKLEPLVNPDTGEVEWYYPQLSSEGIFIPKRLTKDQANRVRKTLDNLAGTTENIIELTDRINYNLIAVDELPNCVPAVRAQLFNLFDGFIEIDGKAYPLGQKLCAHYPESVKELPVGIDVNEIKKLREQGIEIRGSGYSVGLATGNIGQQFTESSNELGRALKDRMHLIIDTDYFRPKPVDTLNMLVEDRNPRVIFNQSSKDKSENIKESYKKLMTQEVLFEKYIIANYLIHGLDYLPEQYGGSKIELKSGWPNKLEGHEAGSDEALILPVSPRAAKSIITLSQALDQIIQEKNGQVDYFNSMRTAFKFASAYSGILNEALVMQNYDENHYKAMDAVIDTTKNQFEAQKENIAAGIAMASKGDKNKKLLDEFSGRWYFMKNLLENLAERK